MSEPFYRVSNWDEHFETSETRKLKALNWVPVPNRMDSYGYVELISHERGPQHYACWIILLHIASRATYRGQLSRDRGKTPHTASSIARLARMDSDLMTEAIDRLVTIGWLEITPEILQVPMIPAESPGAPGDDPGLAPGTPGRRKEGKKEGMNEKTLSLSAGAEPSAVKAMATQEGRKRLLTLLTMHGCSTRMAGEDIFAEWCNAVQSYPMDWIEHLFREEKQRPDLPSKLRKILKAYHQDFLLWKEEVKSPTPTSVAS